MRKSAVVKLIEDLEKLKSLEIYASDINKDDTIETLAAKKGIKEKELITIGLDPKRKIWSNKWVVQQAYKGKGTAKPPSAEETNKLIELGVTFGKTNRKSAVEILIEYLEKLNRIGIYASDIKQIDTIGTVAARKGINEEVLRSIGLDPEDKIGNRINTVKQAHREKGKVKPSSNEEINKLIELGVNFSKAKSAAELLIEDLEKLRSLGIYASDIKLKDTIGTVAARKGINEEEIRKIGLNPEDKIGNRIKTVKQTHREKGKVKPSSNEETNKLIELGVNFSKAKSAAELLIEDLEKLRSLGIYASDIKQIDTIGTMAARKGISEEEIRKIGLNPEDKIGARISTVKQAHREKGKVKPLSNEETNKLIELGVNFGKTKRKSVVEILIEYLEKLNRIGIDASDIKLKDTIGTVAERKGISEEEIRKIGLNPEDKIGARISAVKQAYKGKVKLSSNEEINRLIELGMNFGKTKRKSAVAILIEDLEKLKSLGIDASDIKYKDTIGTVAERKGISEEELRRIGLNPEDKIGIRISAAKQTYKGNGTAKPPSDEETNKLIELGVDFSKAKSAVAILIEDLEKLKSLGIDASDIKYKNTIGTVAERKGISEEEIRKIGLNPEDKIGARISAVKQAYKGKRIVNPSNNKEINRLIELGMNFGKAKRKSVVEILIEDLEKLKSLGIDISGIHKNDTIGTLAMRYKISNEQIRSLGLRLNEKIGNSIDTVRHIFYNKNLYDSYNKFFTIDEKRKLELLVLGRDRSRTGKEIAEASIGSLKQIEMSDREYEIFRNLKEQEKEYEK